MRSHRTFQEPIFSTAAEAEAAARAGDVDGMLVLAACLRRGDGRAVDPAAAEAWLRFALAKAIVFGDEERVGSIQVALAELALERDAADEARAFLECAAEAGEPSAMRRLAELMGEDELEVDLACFLRGRARAIELRLN